MDRALPRRQRPPRGRLENGCGRGRAECFRGGRSARSNSAAPQMHVGASECSAMEAGGDHPTSIGARIAKVRRGRLRTGPRSVAEGG